MVWSNLIVAIVSTLFGTFLGTILTIRGEFISKNLFPERAEWRKTIRDLAIKIESTNIVTVQQQAQIRNNINPYGVVTSIESGNEFFLKDGHIHVTLDQLKDNCTDQNNIENLVKYLALLLKHDWERSKNENKFISFTKSSNKWGNKKYETQVKNIAKKNDTIQLFFELLADEKNDNKKSTIQLFLELLKEEKNDNKKSTIQLFLKLPKEEKNNDDNTLFKHLETFKKKIDKKKAPLPNN